MIETAQQVLSEIAAKYADKRLNIHDLQVEESSEGLKLSGRVLNPAQLEETETALRQVLPDLKLDKSAVQVLRPVQLPVKRVCTNLTGLHTGPSRANELLHQMLYGWQVEILEDQGYWAYVRLEDGYLGWTIHNYLTGDEQPAPTHMVGVPLALLHSRPEAASPLVSRVLGSTCVTVLEQKGDWCRVQANLVGWLPASALRPLENLPQSAEARRAQMLADAAAMTGVQYLWGGISAHGIDCSGLAQYLHRMAGVTIPRDADMQFYAGRPVQPPFRPGDLLFFGEEGERRRITHVGMSIGGWQMVHSSGSHNGVYYDDVQAVDHLRTSFVGAASFLD